MKKVLGLVLALVLCLGVCFLVAPNTVKAAEDDIASGTSGTCSWVIDANGVMTISVTSGDSGVLGSPTQSGWPWNNYVAQVTKVVIEPGVKTGANCSKMFSGFVNCTEMELTNLDTSAATNMNSMFNHCDNMVSLNVGHFDTSHVTNMGATFKYCGKATFIDVGTWDVSKVTTMASMFEECDIVPSLDVSRWNTSSVTSLRDMFYYCPGLKTLDVSNWDTSHVTDMSGTFYRLETIPVLDVSRWDTSSVTTIYRMFDRDAKLTNLDISNWNTANITNMCNAFSGLQGLTSLDISRWNVEKVTDFSGTFQNCKNITSFDFSNWRTLRATNMRSMFSGCSALTSLDLSSFDTHSVQTTQTMFNGCSNLAYLDLSSFNMSAATNMNVMFQGCSKLTRVNLGSTWSFKGNNITDGSNQCVLPSPSGTNYSGKWVREDKEYGPYTPTELRDNYTASMAGIWEWEVRAIPYAVFADDGTLYFVKEVAVYTSGITGTVHSISGSDYSGQIFRVNDTSTSNQNRTWDSVKSQVKKVVFVDEVTPRNINNWFASFTACTDFDLAKLNTSLVTNMGYLFHSCSAVKKLDLSTFDTHRVTNWYCMFYGTTLDELNISNFDTSSIVVSSTSDECFRAAKILKIVLGENFTFTRNNQVRGPETSVYLKTWQREDEAYGPFTPAELQANYTSVMAGTWIWMVAPTEYTIKFVGDEATTGSMMDEIAIYNEDFTLPKNKLVKFGYDFDYWTDGTRRVYQDEDTIPANTYAAGDVVTLTAVFTERDTSVTMEDGAFTFTLRDGERATFKDIPAGTSYQVYELTEDGWVLVQQENTAGVIEALQVSVAQFYNKYMPGITTVQFSGTKTLDSRAVEDAERFYFELWEGETLIETVGNSQGGFIQFSPIEYSDEDVGEHVYTIKEVFDEYDSEIEYDKHEETVTVTVELVDGKITNTVEYDTDGIKFENMTRPGSLKLSKYNNGISTDANEDDEFTFEITFKDESGMLVNDSIYWYIEGEAQVPVVEEPEEPEN